MKRIGKKCCRQYPDNSIARMCEGIIGLVEPKLEAEVSEFFARTP